jgi:hypothetical protein
MSTAIANTTAAATKLPLLATAGVVAGLTLSEGDIVPTS